MGNQHCSAPITDRFMAKVSPEPMSGCWLWLGVIDASGYGRFGIGSHADGSNRMAQAHRVAYELFRGAIPDGMELDHLCRLECCVNPAHLEPVTHRVNCLRGTGQGAINATKTHCLRGHEFTPENTIINQGKRYCRECNRLRTGRERLRRQAERSNRAI